MMIKIILTICFLFNFLFIFELEAHVSKEHDNLFGWGGGEETPKAKVIKKSIQPPPVKKEVVKKRSVVKQPIQTRPIKRKIVKKRPVIKPPVQTRQVRKKIVKKRRVVRRPVQRRPIIRRPAVQRFKPVQTLISSNYAPEMFAKPGKCYTTAYIEDKCSKIKKRVVSKDSYVERIIIPAVTKLITQKVLMREAFIVQEQVPPLYEIRESKILIKAAHTIWKRGSFTATQKTISGKTYCLVQVPPEYRIEKKKVLRIRGSYIKKNVPAVYKKVQKVIVLKEEQVKTKRIVPQRYETVQMCLANKGYYEWVSILCNENATENVLIKVEKALSAKGLLNQPFVDGIIDQDTETALRQYQKQNSLRISGLLTIETVKLLGVKY